MAERSPIPQPEERFANPYESRFLQHGNEVKLLGDPETPEDFARAQNYLEAITNHLIEFGPVWEKQPQDIVEELAYHNAWHKAEVEAERKAGVKQAEYREISLKQLQALSKRRILAFEETGWEVTHDYRLIAFFNDLISAAVLEQEQLEQLMAASCPQHTGSLEPSNDCPEELPF